MSRYQIVTDEQALNEFIAWLPDLEEFEKFYVALFARKKYDDTLQSTSSDKMQLKRFLASKGTLVQKLRQLEVDYGLYRLKSTIATQQSLAVYISPNPRDVKHAQKQALIKFATAIAAENYYKNPHAEMLSCVQRAKSFTYVVDFDIDNKEVDLTVLQGILPPRSYTVLETRGGFHLLVDPIKASSIQEWPAKLRDNAAAEKRTSKWYVNIKNRFDVDNAGDQLMPIPGCTQGGFTPRFLNLEFNTDI